MGEMNYKKAGSNSGRKPSAAGAQSRPGRANARNTMGTGGGSKKTTGAMTGKGSMNCTGVMGK
jgi:hypothetical protein